MTKSLLRNFAPIQMENVKLYNILKSRSPEASDAVAASPDEESESLVDPASVAAVEDGWKSESPRIMSNKQPDMSDQEA